MGMIKTALEIALEKTETVKSDKSSIGQFETRKRGKQLANAFLAGELESAAALSEAVKKAAAAERDSLKQGIFDVLIAQISLPAGSSRSEASGRKESDSKIERLGEGLSAVIKTKEFSIMYKQLVQICSQYLQEAVQYEQMVQQQYAPKLRKKEEDLSRRLGREVRIDPFQDPEFAAFYNQHMSALKNNYEPVIAQAREETRRMFEEAK